MPAQAKVIGAWATDKAITIAKIVRKTDTPENVRFLAVMMTTLQVASRGHLSAESPSVLFRGGNLSWLSIATRAQLPRNVDGKVGKADQLIRGYKNR
jgi:hypothetical protein